MSHQKIVEKFRKLLGVHPGSAQRKLSKSIEFSLVIETGRDTCYRCGKKITKDQDFSVEHMEDWMTSDNPIDRFYNLNNIAFSHRKCNTRCAKDSKGKDKVIPLLIYKNT
jgi:hypothetical protein